MNNVGPRMDSNHNTFHTHVFAFHKGVDGENGEVGRSDITPLLQNFV